MQKIAILLLFLHNVCAAQDFEKRYSFAKAYFGVDFNYVPNYGKSYFLNDDNAIESFERNGFLSPAINIGATHFWGYADFYVSINTANIKAKKDRIPNTTGLGALVGLKFYPLQLKDHKLRPYIGYKFAALSYTQRQLSDETHTISATKSVLDIGLGWRKPNLYAYIGYNRAINPDFETYLSRTQTANTTFPKHIFNVGINWMIETTKMADSKKSREVHEKLDKVNKAGFFVGVGPSSAFPLVSSSYIEKMRPYLNNKSILSLFPEISTGYHFTKQDFVIALAFRPMTQKRSAFSFDQQIRRKSLVIETYKYLGDYHGFAPFLGGGLGFERLSLTEDDRGQTITEVSENKITPVITFGWDIRPARKGDIWLLRTCLRYAPSLAIPMQDQSLSLQHLEFNFIQFILYPNRIKEYKN